MNSNNFINEYKDFLLANIPSARQVAGGKEVLCRCFYCSDSADPSHAHMYISLPKSDKPSMFHCVKCHSSGIVNANTLMAWGIYDSYIATQLGTIAKNSKNKGYSEYKRVIPFMRLQTYDANLAINKLNYINNRLGLHFSLQDLEQEKIVLNLGDFIQANHISSLTRHPNIINQLNQYFCGFLSFDNNFINCRRICDDGIVYKGIDKRYINYNIFNKEDNTEKFYLMPATIDLNYPAPINIHIAEGPFDIVSIKYNVSDHNSRNIYVGITGSTYKGTLRHLITTLGLFYINVHVYPDNDDSGDSYIMRDLIEYLSPYNMHIYIHRNSYPYEKDYGVPKDRIIDSIEKVR